MLPQKGLPVNWHQRSGQQPQARSTHQFSRRTMLRGVGVSMALPWMESLRAFADDMPNAANLNQPPTPMAILFAGCGFHRPRAEAAAILSKLTPIAVSSSGTGIESSTLAPSGVWKTRRKSSRQASLTISETG